MGGGGERERERQHEIYTQTAQEKQISPSDSICENGKYQFVYEAYCKVNAPNMRWKRANATANQTKRINLIKITLHICAYLSTLFHMSFTLLTLLLPPSAAIIRCLHDIFRSSQALS